VGTVGTAAGGIVQMAARDGYSHINSCTRTTITMCSSSMGTARKRALSDPEVSDVGESDRKKAKYTGVDYGHPTVTSLRQRQHNTRLGRYRSRG
jgi:hypothetical protein